MPVVERSDRQSKPNILLWGCGGCALFAVILCVAGYCFFVRAFNQIISTTPPPKSSAPYVFTYNKQAMHCSIILPDKNGTLIYSHLLSNTSVYWGVRALEVKDNTGKLQEWPLPYSHLKDVKVGVYWYPAKKGLGPFIRFYDATGNFILDLGTREIGQLLVTHGRNQTYKHVYDVGQYGHSIETDAKGNVLTVTDAYGKPAREISAAVTPTNCVYLGSIIRKGNSLVFQQNPKGGIKKP